MDDDISNINNITRFRPYDGKNESQGKGKRKKKKKPDDQDVQNEDGMTDANGEDGEQGDSEGDDVGHNIDVDI